MPPSADHDPGNRVRTRLSAGGSRIRTLGPRHRQARFAPRFREITLARDSPLQEDGFELSVPGDTIKVLRSLHVDPANVKSAERSSDTGEPCGRRSPASSRPSDERRGPRRPVRSPPRSGTADRYAMRVLVGQPFIRLRRRRAAHQRSYRCLLRLWA
jgi:hypothetical protein